MVTKMLFLFANLSVFGMEEKSHTVTGQVGYIFCFILIYNYEASFNFLYGAKYFSLGQIVLKL